MALGFLGWFGWGVLLVVTIISTFGAIYRPLVGLPGALNVIILFGWLLLCWTYYDDAFNKLHLFWLAPLVWTLGILGTSYFFILLHTHVPGFIVAVAALTALLWWLAP
jgi:hypothetical protein